MPGHFGRKISVEAGWWSVPSPATAWGIGAVRFETRVGASAAIIPEFAEESGTDMIALGWAQDLAPGRAPVVRAALARGCIPVMLIPVKSTPSSLSSM